MGDLSYEQALSELHSLIGENVQVFVYAWDAGRNERLLVVSLAGTLAAGYAADFSAIAAQLPSPESVVFAVQADADDETRPTFFVISRADFQGAARREPGPGVGFVVGGAFVAVEPAA